MTSDVPYWRPPTPRSVWSFSWRLIASKPVSGQRTDGRPHTHDQRSAYGKSCFLTTISQFMRSGRLRYNDILTAQKGTWPSRPLVVATLPDFTPNGAREVLDVRHEWQSSSDYRSEQ